ncbi:uncharacterized protein I303_102341 [Kwoniella dejecticola CBS 10117]|uniref:Ricin B lectin domain-containing protein n=1 Tax=Kwoniella dejecticola CBS 10117 TaxID=1296121 RepID=A0A1A6AB72_9TREE|nr:uncharacterized protein I303_01518 [Kwoniella dejecticola CBS 10117]OBR87316.1 hypothetical protein I303_01518 [Kwoniella dejecticola CBS 10117]
MAGLIVVAALALSMALATPISSDLDKRYTAIRIKSFRNGECLHPTGQKSTWTAGTRVGTAPCERAALWNADPGSGSVILYDTGWALDAGTGLEDGEHVMLQQSRPGSFQQTWFWIDDNRLAITGGTQCLDQGTDQEGTQILQCFTDNTNQIWTLLTTTPENPEFDPPFGTVYEDPPSGGKRLHPYQRPDLALTLDGGYRMEGRSAVIAYSQPNEGPHAAAQLLNLTIGTNQMISSAFDPTACLDAEYRPRNGAVARFTGCGGAASWDWDGRKLRMSSYNLCLDVRAESTRFNKILKTLQVWECFEGNTNQEFFTLG